MAQDYYEVLGVARSATQEEIQQAYRKLARRHHPDVNKDPKAEERFKDVNEAYNVLADPDTRARYDRFGPDFRQIPEDYDERVAAGAAAAAGAGPPPAAACASPRGRAAPTRTWTSRISSAACSAGAAGPAGPYRAPTRRPRWSCPWRRRTGAGGAGSASPGRRAGAITRSPFPGGAGRAADPAGRRGRPGQP